MPKPLRTYLRTKRKKSGLSLEELAFLLGVRHTAKVSRYERLARTPTLKNLFALQIVYGELMHDLFPGIFEDVRSTIIRRAEALAADVKKRRKTPQAKRKLAALEAIIRGEGLVQRQKK